MLAGTIRHKRRRRARSRIESKCRHGLGKALAPREIIFVGDIPKTRNAKVMRRIVPAAYLGEKLGDTSALENPASLDEIKSRRDVTQTIVSDSFLCSGACVAPSVAV
jgi:hypothetical protein